MSESRQVFPERQIFWLSKPRCSQGRSVADSTSVCSRADGSMAGNRTQAPAAHPHLTTGAGTWLILLCRQPQRGCQRHISCSLAEFLTSYFQRKQVQHLLFAYCPTWSMVCLYMHATNLGSAQIQSRADLGFDGAGAMLGSVLEDFWELWRMAAERTDTVPKGRDGMSAENTWYEHQP